MCIRDRGGDIVQILRIPEKDEHGGKDQLDTDVEDVEAVEDLETLVVDETSEDLHDED